MSGLDKILTDIADSGKQSSESIIAAAREKAEKIRIDGRQKAEKSYDDLMKKYRSEIELEYSNMCSSAETRSKREILECKVGCINEAMEKVIEKLDSLPEDEYFGLIIKLAGKYIGKGKGVMSFGKRDLERLPKNFKSELSVLAGEPGSSVSISDKPADISDGFILSYGDISENCSFRAILEAESDLVRDKIASVLFG